MSAQQLRALADREEREAETYAGGQTFGGTDPAEERYFELIEVADALRTAADQFEALDQYPHDCVCQWPHGDDHPEAYGNYCTCWKSELK